MSCELMLDYFTQVVIPTIETKFPDQEVIITMDNARCHPPELLMNLHENIRVEFLPPNTTPLIQPCDQEVILSLKSKLKEMYFNRLLSFIRENWQSEGDLYTKFLRQHSLLDSICDLCKAWFEVPQSIIKRSFNNLLKKKELSDSLYQAIDFEGFENRQIRDASFTRVTDEDQQLTHIQDVAHLTKTFNQLSQEITNSTHRERIFVTSDQDIIEDLELQSEAPEDIINDYISEIDIQLDVEADLVNDMAEDEECTLEGEMSALRQQILNLQQRANQ